MASIPAHAPVAAKPRKASRLWWHVHQWVGFKLSLLLGFVLLTGTLAVFSAEIDWLIHPSLRVAPASVGSEPDWEAIVAGAAEHPGIGQITAIGSPTASAFATRVSIKRADGQLGYLHVHPATGTVQGEQGFVDAQRILRNMHRHLNLPAKYGIPLVTALSFLLLVSVITSLVVYKKWWRGFLRWPRGRDARTWWGDFHRLAGVWSLWFVALIALTGIWYFLESVGGEAPAMPRAEAPGFSESPGTAAAQFPAALAAARRADPQLRITEIRFPDADNGVFAFQGQKSAVLVRSRANSVYVDAATALPLLVTDARELDVHNRISEMADPLHFGTWGGYWSKIIWFSFGLLLTCLAVSGVAIYGLRIAREARQVVPTRQGLAIAWAALGHWRWPAIVLILISFTMIPGLFVASS